DKRMTRFWITLEASVDLVLSALATMQGAEVFIPKIPSMKITDLAKAVGPKCKLEEVGIRPGEKLHEVLVTEEEAARAADMGGHYVVGPAGAPAVGGKKLPDNFRFSSDANKEWLTEKELVKMVESLATK